MNNKKRNDIEVQYKLIDSNVYSDFRMPDKKLFYENRRLNRQKYEDALFELQEKIFPYLHKLTFAHQFSR